MRRRRSIEPEPYGYANRPHMMNNYGGTMPYQTPYGYSGYNAYPPQSQANVAMYAVGGLAAGAGAMYMYNNMYGGHWGDHRRRRFGDFRSQSFCQVTASGSRQGAFMECQTCYNLYGFASCPSAEECRSAMGCRYTTAQSFARDELSATGFIPKGFTPPLKVTFTNITGQGINSAAICPPLTEADISLAEQFNRTMSFKPELFLVLSRQDVLAGPTEVGNGTSGGFVTVSAVALLCFLRLVSHLFSHL